MPHQNRVLPTGELVYHPDYRGMFMGNRGILHDAEGRLTRRRWEHKAWVTCALSFKGRRRTPLMRSRHYTELFFHDEAVAFAAGHRPCAECRRADYRRFRELAGIRSPISHYDRTLHAERAVPRVWQQRRWSEEIAGLPDGAFVLLASDTAALVLGDRLLPFAPSGYGAPAPRPKSGSVTVLTPRPLLDVLRAGYPVRIRQRA